jgi:glycosyltransferase involved in cell wall biosynthesis
MIGMSVQIAAATSAASAAPPATAASEATAAEVDVSVLVPVLDEAETVEELGVRVAAVLDSLGSRFEILFVDDGSRDGTLDRLAELAAGDPHVRVISLRRNFGKAAALAVGFREVRGARVVTLDGDLQDDPAEIPNLLAALDEGYDLVSGWKRRRRDPFTKTVPSRVWNWMTARVTGIPLHDFNCGLKAYRSEVVKSIRVYGEMHRYLPVLADRLGFRVTEREVRHHPRRAGRSKYGGARFLNGFLDLLTVVFLGSARRSPLHLFGRIGVAFVAVGLAIDVYLAGVWAAEGRLRVRPILLLALILVIVGMQFISMGLLAEMIAGGQRENEDYPVRRRIPEPGASEEER